jgi:hypothetical protein
LWFYEVGNGLLMAYRRKRITLEQIDGFLTRLKNFSIDAAQQVPTDVLELPAIAQKHSLTNYGALATRFRLLWQQPTLNCGGRPLKRASRLCLDRQNLFREPQIGNFSMSRYPFIGEEDARLRRSHA